jgi:hypothetical protein
MSEELHTDLITKVVLICQNDLWQIYWLIILYANMFNKLLLIYFFS